MAGLTDAVFGQQPTTVINQAPGTRPPGFNFARSVFDYIGGLAGSPYPSYSGQLDPGMGSTMTDAIRRAQGYAASSPSELLQGTQGVIGRFQNPSFANPVNRIFGGSPDYYGVDPSQKIYGGRPASDMTFQSGNPYAQQPQYGMQGQGGIGQFLQMLMQQMQPQGGPQSTAGSQTVMNNPIGMGGMRNASMPGNSASVGFGNPGGMPAGQQQGGYQPQGQMPQGGSGWTGTPTPLGGGVPNSLPYMPQQAQQPSGPAIPGLGFGIGSGPGAATQAPMQPISGGQYPGSGGIYGGAPPAQPQMGMQSTSMPSFGRAPQGSPSGGSLFQGGGGSGNPVPMWMGQGGTDPNAGVFGQMGGGKMPPGAPQGGSPWAGAPNTNPVPMGGQSGAPPSGGFPTPGAPTGKPGYGQAPGTFEGSIPGAQKAWSMGNLSNYGQTRMGEDGKKKVYVGGGGSESGQWVDFNPMFHSDIETLFNNYGSNWSSGSKAGGGHSGDIAGHFKNAFGRDPSLTEKYNYYYGTPGYDPKSITPTSTDWQYQGPPR